MIIIHSLLGVIKRLLVCAIVCFVLFASLVVSAFSDESPSGEKSGEDIVEIALQYEGYPYVYGGSSENGFDCSGFVYFVYGNAGYKVSRVSSSQYYDGELIELNELDLGDVVLFANTYKRGISHSGIFIGDNRFIHAASPGQGVIITDLSDSYYAARFVTGVRIADRITSGVDKPATDNSKRVLIPKKRTAWAQDITIEYMTQ